AIPPDIATHDFVSMLEFAWCHAQVDRRRFLELVDQLTCWAAYTAVDESVRARLALHQSVAATMEGWWVEGGALARRALRSLGDGWWRDPLGRFGWNMVAREVALSERWDDWRVDVQVADLAMCGDPELRLE